MARYTSDQNKVVLIHESGTYASTSGNGYWPGEITENSIDDAENKLEDRYLGTASRSFGDFEQGPRDVTGTLTYNMQDLRFPFWALGSNVDGGAANKYTHVASEVQSNVWQSPFTSGTGQITAPISFSLEDSKQAPGTGRNFVRTINGCVINSITITASQGEKIRVDMDYIGQTLAKSSGTTTSVTADASAPFKWSSAVLTLAGSPINTAKEISLEINKNMNAPHYVNGSRDIGVPFEENRDYTLNLTWDVDSNLGDMLYGIYKNNGSFNAVWDMDQDTSAGSQHAVFVMSGCRITAMDNPSTAEGVTEGTIEIRPKNIAGSCWDNVATYNPW